MSAHYCQAVTACTSMRRVHLTSSTTFEGQLFTGAAINRVSTSTRRSGQSTCLAATDVHKESHSTGGRRRKARSAR
ncbi:hypothetical protein LSTR_LSTR000753 [Laodelphax striatellus]|uniref:Uncharacterized protein n=1 Tax=Laodelphax striatellus TaxID=195883 RepID=A0A482WY55_LAOST|nr:hypothetical protein LSTR_LSTR016240 [Laodelphax striatellus]RZF44801.1 hypothetical protein LSTR_LSTR000753 [Laodelphax striatellus]